MAKVERLTTGHVTALIKKGPPGFYADGKGLYLDVRVPKSSASWRLRIEVRKQRYERGLGSAFDIGLAEAREIAGEYRKQFKQGIDPSRKVISEAPQTFEEVARKFAARHTQGLKSAKSKRQWVPTFERHVFPHIGRLQIDKVESPDILRVLDPIWQTKPVMAKSLMDRLRNVFNWAKANGYRCGLDNPVEMLKHKGALPAQVRGTRHHPALPHEGVGQFVRELRESKAEKVTKLAFEFLILTVTRTEETTDARWDEVNWTERTWTIPPGRMKLKHAKDARPHVVLLSDRALEILDEAKALGSDEFVFPSPLKPNRPIANGSFLNRLRCAGLTGKVTGHGFRSSFKRWAGTETNFDRDAIEISMAHAIGGKVEAAYWRDHPMIKKRRVLMQAWADYVAGKTPNADNVIQMPARASA
jgi:integrase